jgi:hypothetical protein
MKWLVRLAAVALIVLLNSGGTSALTQAECAFVSVGGTVAVCHATGSAQRPYVLVRVNEHACVRGHADHAGDFVSVDGTCSTGGACLAQGASCDSGGTPCCAGLTCSFGTCGSIQTRLRALEPPDTCFVVSE